MTTARTAEAEFPTAVLFLSIARLSAADRAAGGDEPIGIGVQREVGHRAALRRGLGIVKEFIEIGVPADSLRNRPVLRRLMAYLESHPDIRYIIYTGTYPPYTHIPPHAISLYHHFKRLGVSLLFSAPDSPPEQLRLWESI